MNGLLAAVGRAVSEALPQSCLIDHHGKGLLIAADRGHSSNRLTDAASSRMPSYNQLASKAPEKNDQKHHIQNSYASM